jgi:hypothetical protein
MDEALRTAYRRTSFTAETPKGRLTIRIGEHCTALDALLTHHAVSTWAYITAYNPGSVRLSDGENIARQTELERLISQQAVAVYRGHGIGDDGDWPHEVSCLILGIPREDARELGRRFEQIAIVAGRCGGEAELVLCETTNH